MKLKMNDHFYFPDRPYYSGQRVVGSNIISEPTLGAFLSTAWKSMTTGRKPTNPRHLYWNLNTLVGVGSIGSVVGSLAFFLAPLKTIPIDVRTMREDINNVKQSQAIQAEALRTLSDLSQKSTDLRREFDVHRVEMRAALDRHTSDIMTLQKVSH